MGNLPTQILQNLPHSQGHLLLQGAFSAHGHQGNVLPVLPENCTPVPIIKDPYGYNHLRQYQMLLTQLINHSVPRLLDACDFFWWRRQLFPLSWEVLAAESETSSYKMRLLMGLSLGMSSRRRAISAFPPARRRRSAYSSSQILKDCGLQPLCGRADSLPIPPPSGLSSRSGVRVSLELGVLLATCSLRGAIPPCGL